MRLFKYFLPILLFLTQKSLGQHGGIDSLFLAFRNDIEIEQKEHAGTTIFDDDTRISFYRLLINSTANDLIKYINDSNPAVRSYIFAGLIKRTTDSSLINTILMQHIDDTASFSTMSTDVWIPWKVNEYMQMHVKQETDGTSKVIDFENEIKRIESKFRIIINGTSHGLISKEALLQLDSLVSSVKNIKICSFKLIVGRKTMKSSSNILSQRMKRCINRLESNGILVFDDIKLEIPDLTNRYYGVIKLKIK